MKLSKSSMALLLFMSEEKLEQGLSRTELRALDRACSKLEEHFDDKEPPPVAMGPRGLMGYFGYNGEPVEIDLSKAERDVLGKYWDASDPARFSGAATRKKYITLEDEWVGTPEE